MLRRFVFHFAWLCLAFVGVAGRGQEVLDGIAAVVNDTVITFLDVRTLTGEKEKELRKTGQGEELTAKVKELRLGAIDTLIDRALILEDFKNRGLSVPESFIDGQVEDVIENEFAGNRDTFLQQLARQDATLEECRDHMREVDILQEMRKKAVEGLTQVPEARIRAYYEAHAREYSQPEQIQLRIIVIRRAEDESRLKLIEEIRQKIVEGAEFGELARMYSEDSTRERGGDWGWIDRKTLNETLTQAAFGLKPGEMSPVIAAGDRYYLLRCEAKKAAEVKPLPAVRDEIEKGLLQSERQSAEWKWIDGLRRKAYIKMF